MDSLIVALIGVAFLIMYLFDKDVELRFIWLLVGVSLVAYSGSVNNVLINTAYNSTSGITTYNYGSDNALVPISTGLAGLFVLTIVIFIYRVISVYRGDYDAKKR